ncbi:hypothetical protein [Streptomyces sp. NPDC001744]|uniref:hypothetical protein n=1 Tax=Streptomyces sp. NPDC001744 TaxID=3364606 RepID=UPI0036951AEA
MFDFSTLDRLALDGTNVVLRPVFDPRLYTFSVQLWEDGQPGGIHGLVEHFRYADQPVETIDAFLAENGVRATTGEEAALLYAGLVQAKGGPDWALLLLSIGADEDDAQECDECSAVIASDAPSAVHESHEPSCSLHPDNAHQS